MFTGIVEELGTIKNIQRESQGAILEVHANEVLTDAKKRKGAKVNIEIDLIARYLETLLKNSGEENDWTEQSQSETLNRKIALVRT